MRAGGQLGDGTYTVHVHIMATEVKRGKELEDERILRID